MRQYNEDFNGKCCDENFQRCDWTCSEISQRIASRASIATVYNRAEIDSKLATLRSLVSLAYASNSILIDELANRPPANSSNAGYLFVTNVTIPTSGTSYPQQTFVSNGSTWIELINREDFTSESSYTGDMEKSEYTNGTNPYITINMGGTGRNLSLSNEGPLLLFNGTVNSTQNYKPTNVYTSSTDLLLTNNSASTQIIQSNVSEIFLPDVPLVTTYFRLINTSANNQPIVKYNNNTVSTLNTESATDFHYNDVANQWILISHGISN